MPSRRLTAGQLVRHRFIDKVGVGYEGSMIKNRVRKESMDRGDRGD